MQKLDSYDGDWALYMKNPYTGEEIEINSHQMTAASLIKLYIMAAFFEREQQGGVNLSDENRDLLEKMITVSDNSSSNDIVRQIGGGDTADGREIVNVFCQSKGFNDTRQNRDLGVAQNVQNYTSVRDVGALLEVIYREKCISGIADRYMLDLLRDQQLKNKIPAGVPEGVIVANKTGELEKIENDAAIVFSPGGDYILCIMSSNLDSEEKGRERIVEISALIYAYFNP